MIPLFLQSWNRPEFTSRVINTIRERTAPDSIRLHVLDNGSDAETVDMLLQGLRDGGIDSLHLENRNTGCLWPKHVFHAMTPDDNEFAIITDNDFIPCKGWLPGLLGIMERNKDLAMIAPFYWPYWPMNPLEDRGEYIRATAIGNTFKLCRRHAIEMVIHDIPQKLGAYGDDGMLCHLLGQAGWEIGIAKNIFCYNLEMTADQGGYTTEQTKQDPRRAHYSPIPHYTPKSWDTLEPPDELKWKPNV